MQTIELSIGGMGCQGCVRAVSSALKAVAGVESVQVDLAAGRAVVQFDAGVTGPDELIPAVEQAGYTAAVAQAA